MSSDLRVLNNRGGGRAAWATLFLAAWLLAAVLVGCGGGDGGGATSTTPTAPPAMGTVALTLQYAQVKASTPARSTPASKPSAKRVANSANGGSGIPTEAATFVVHVLDDRGADVRSPFTVTRTAGQPSQVVTIPDVPVGAYRVLVEMFAQGGAPLGFSPPMPVTVAAESTVAVATATAVTVTALSLTPPTMALARGTAGALAAAAVFSDGSSATVTGQSTWSSSASTIATADRYGTVAGHAVGAATITASFGGEEAAAGVVVTDARLTGLSVTPPSPSRAKGTTVQLSAMGTFSDGTTQDLTAQVRWSTSAPSVASVSDTGLAFGAGVGAATVTATFVGQSASATVTITPATPVSIAVTPTNPSVAKGLTQLLVATGTYTDGTTQNITDQVTWTSSNPARVAVSSGGGNAGLSTAVSVGSAIVAATFPGTPIAGTTTVTVTAAELVSIAVTPTNPSVAKGLTQQLTATGTYTDSSVQDLTMAVTWSSSDEAKAPVSNASGTKGLATALTAGATTVTAMFPGTQIAGSTTLTVTAAQLVSLAVTPTAPSVAKGLTKQFTATGTYTDNTHADITTAVTWSSSDITKATVSNAAGTEGLASALATGTPTITATYPNTQISDSTTLTVTAAELVSIAVTPTAPSVAKGLTRQFTATGTYTDNTHADITTAVTWSSSDEAKATVSNAAGTEGLATTLATGTTTIKAVDPTTSIEGSTTLTVTAAALVSIEVTPAAPSVAKGLTKQFTATGTYTDNTHADITTAVTWSSSDEAKATVSNAASTEGLATTVAVGTTTVKAVDPTTSIEGSTTLTVTAAELVSIAVTPDEPSVAKGLPKQFTATGTYTDNTQTDITTAVTWSSSDTATATISNASGTEGLSTTLATGATTIKAVDPTTSLEGNTTLTVTAAALVSIAVTPAAPSVAKGLTKQFTATGTYTDSTQTDITTAVTWSSSDTATATISNASGSEGLSTTLATGATTIKAVDPTTSIEGSTTLTVTSPVLVSLAVTPANASMLTQQIRSYKATGTYTDGSTQDLTGSVTWSSSDTAKATIASGGATSGRVTSVAVGTSNITADAGGGISASTGVTVTRPTYSVNGTVRAIALGADGTKYVGGNFTSVSPLVGNGVALDDASGLAFAAPVFNGTVWAVAADGQGGWYVGGDFTQVGGVTRNRLAHIRADGTLDAAWNPSANSTVRALAVSGSTVYAGGYFSNIGGQWRNCIAALDATRGLATAWNPSAINGVYALAVSGSTVYAGGYFTSIGGQTRNYIAALDATTGLATAWNPSANNGVQALAVSGSTVYAGGYFTSIGGQTRNRIAALDASTGLATDWNPSANDGVQTLAVSGSTVYAGGYFTSIGGQTRNRIAALDASTGLATDWNPNASSYVCALAVSGSTVYAGGYFTSIGGQTRNYIAAFTPSGDLADWNPNANSYVYALAVSGSTVYAGGYFGYIGGQSRSYIAALDATTGLATAWNPNASDSVYTIAVSGNGTVYAGGAFYGIGGSNRVHLAALDPNTGGALSWEMTVYGEVRALAVSSDGARLYVGGTFQSVYSPSFGSRTAQYLIVVQPFPGGQPLWTGPASAPVHALALSGGRVYTGGLGTIFAHDAYSGSIAWWSYTDSTVRSLAVSGSTVYIGGDFTSIGGEPRNYTAALDLNGNLSAWNPNASSYVYALAVSGSTVYAGGFFSSIGGQPTGGFAALDATTGAVVARVEAKVKHALAWLRDTLWPIDTRLRPVHNPS